jgi:hypothetical protein
MPADEPFGSSHARGAAHSPPRAGAGERLPGAVCAWCSHSIDIALVSDKGDNCGCWQRTPRAGCHRLLGAAPGHEAPGWLDNGVSRLAGS